MKLRAAIWMVSIGLTFATGIPRARAAEDPEALIRQGTELRRRGDNVRAHGYFSRAYDLAKTPRSAAQLGLAELALADYARAELHLSEALAGNDAWVRQNQKTIEQNRDRARQRMLQAEFVGAPPATTVAVADRPATPLPASGVLWLPAGSTSVRVEAPGYTGLTLEIIGEAGLVQRVELSMSPVTSPSAPPPPGLMGGQRPFGADQPMGEAPGVSAASAASPTSSTSAHTLRIGGMVTSGLGVAAFVGGVLLLQKGNRKVDHIEAAPRAGVPYDPADGNFQTLQRAGTGLMIGGGVAAASGLVLYLLGRRTDGPVISLSGSDRGQRSLLIGGRF